MNTRIRKRFSESEYLNSDTPGKILVSRFLNHSFKNSKAYKNVFVFDNVDEDLTCGDIKVKNLLNDEIIRHEVEVPASSRFNLLWNLVYDDLSCTSKLWENAINGHHFLVDKNDAHINGLPNRLMVVKIKDILDHGKIQHRKAKNNPDKEDFFHVNWKYVKFLTINEQGNKYGTQSYADRIRSKYDQF
jgi:hypothetical protein